MMTAPNENEVKMGNEIVDDAGSRGLGVIEYDSFPESLPQVERQPSGCDSVELQRINTYRLQQQQTVGSSHSRPPKDQWLPLGAGKPYPPSLPDPEDYIVEFEGATDPLHPQNWAMRTRYENVFILPYCVL